MKPQKPNGIKTDTAVAKRTLSTTEYLNVAFTQDELLLLGSQLARAMQAKNDLEEEMAAKRAEWKDTGEGLDRSIRTLQRKLHAGGEYRDTLCKWIYEMPSLDEKTLVRMDTGEQVRVVPMQGFDRQDGLPVGNLESGTEPLELTPPNGHATGKDAAAGPQ